MLDALSGRIAQLRAFDRGLALLVHAQRHAGIFALYESAAPDVAIGTFQAFVDELWRYCDGGAAAHEIDVESLERIIPGEAWVTDGFHDGLAQYIGGLAIDAFALLSGRRGAFERGEGEAGFEALRGILSEMRHGCLDPGDNDVGRAFEQGLHEEPLMRAELTAWDECLALLEKQPGVAELQQYAVRSAVPVQDFKAALYQGILRDMNS